MQLDDKVAIVKLYFSMDNEPGMTKLACTWFITQYVCEPSHRVVRDY